MKKLVFIIFLIIFISTAYNVSADSIGENKKFFIESSYDFNEREEITAVLVKTTPKAYFYIDRSWWNSNNQNEISGALSNLGEEFNKNIYPVLTSTFGFEWNPGIDKESKVTVLIHSMNKDAGGYFSSKDEYSKFETSDSNEREMVYLNSDYLLTPLAKSFLAHEFIHLITFNQKDNAYNISEETWLNEARAEYASTLVGYDDNYSGSNLEQRVEIFSNNPFDSLIEWNGRKEDYGVLNLFTQYLVDHYGIEILVDSLQIPRVGIESINYALEKNGFEEDFSQIFLDWTIAVLINDCNYGPKYCYLNENLTRFTVTPRTNFLPLTGNSTLSVVDVIRNWTGNWYKIIGGRGDLELEFMSTSSNYFAIPYILWNRSGSYKVNFLDLKGSQEGKISIEDFGKDITSLMIIPIVNKKNNQSFYSFSWTVSTKENQEESDLVKELLTQINFLTSEIAKIQAKITAILTGKQVAGANHENPGCQNCQSCQKIENNLSHGMMNSQEVNCLQEFLKSQGFNIYPQGLVTGNFLSLTQQAVIRFQEKYASEILAPWGLTEGNGFVGKNTKIKINQLLGK